MMSKKTRKQHYIGQHYLRAWAVDGRKLYCRREGKVFPVATTNVAHIKDFYRLHELSDSDLAIIDQLVLSRIDGELRIVHENWLSIFTHLFDLQRAYNAAVAGGSPRSEEIEKELDVSINDLEERLHSSVEGPSSLLLDELRNGNLSVLQDSESFMEFAFYIALQHLRTAAMRKTLLGAVTALPKFNFEAAWGVLRVIFATNIGRALVLYRRGVDREGLKISLLDAPHGTSFITGDQPVINTHAVGLGGKTPPQKLELYYPISPSRALLITHVHEATSYDKRMLTRDAVLSYNKMIASMSDEQLYAASEDDFRDL
jgi:hypothetical protein